MSTSACRCGWLMFSLPAIFPSSSSFLLLHSRPQASTKAQIQHEANKSTNTQVSTCLYYPHIPPSQASLTLPERLQRPVRMGLV
jgi:hypothetical protein